MAVVRVVAGEIVISLGTTLLIVQAKSHRAQVIVLTIGIILGIALIIGSFLWDQRQKKRKEIIPIDETATFRDTKVGESTAEIDSTADVIAADSEFKKLGGKWKHRPPAAGVNERP